MTTSAPISPADPVSQETFAALMARLGPFEARPEIAVGVSGGADSMAAVLLTRDWLRARGGKLVAVIVDHALRAESAEEAALVAQRLAELEVETVVLRWQGEKPQSNIQAAARQARRRLLSDFCARRGILHLVLGHHREDQAETFLMRLSRGSGLFGLAGMGTLQELPAHRLLRPLLSVSKARLIATLEARGVRWVEDPSNLDPRFTRTLVRGLLPDLAATGITSEKLVETTDRLGRARDALEAAVTKNLARALWFHPAGIAFLKPAVLSSAPTEVGLRALTRVLMAVSGADYGPRSERLERLYGEIAAGLISGTTLSGCRVTPWRQSLVVYRENRHVMPSVVKTGEWMCWDGRFDVFARDGQGDFPSDLTIGPLGRDGWAAVRGAVDIENLGFPAFAAEAVPAVRDDKGVTAAPHLGYFRDTRARDMVETCRFRSGISLTGVAFTVA